MNGPRFDQISKFFAGRRRPGRQAVRLGEGGSAAAGAARHEATPAPGDDAKGSYLFVQSFRSGSIAAKDGEEGAYTVTLEHGLGQTVYFSNRPARDVGAVPTGDFLQGLGFDPDNPPNAALLVEDGSGGTTVAVVQLRNPVFDATGPSLTYDVTATAEKDALVDIDLDETAVDLADIASSFGRAHLFIDGCPEGLGGVFCLPCGEGDTCNPATGSYRTLPTHFCFHGPSGRCLPCEGLDVSRISGDAVQWVTGYWTNRCNQAYPDFCHGECITSWSNISP